ncbi:uncharacterized protein TNCV_4222361 [Trichonephila clavipes]|nr:uncharacterized protein TNCV_4222361 [Trichonephila clavipes]
MPISKDWYEEAWQKLLDSGKNVGPKNEPIAQRTMFGWVVAASAPYLATHCLFQTELDLERDNPAALSLIKESFYNDDLMAGAPSTTRGLLATDHVILNHGQVTWTTPELAPPLLTTTPHQWEDVSALDRFNVHRCPTAIYVVQPQADGNTKVTLLVAKTTMAPPKPVSIPRLELNGALLLARLYATCKNILKEYDVHFMRRTDSQVVFILAVFSSKELEALHCQ